MVAVSPNQIINQIIKSEVTWNISQDIFINLSLVVF